MSITISVLTGAMVGEVVCSAGASSLSFRSGTELAEYVGVMENSGKPLRPPWPGCCKCEGEGEGNGNGNGDGGVESRWVGSLLTKSQSEFRAFSLCLRPSIHLQMSQGS